MSDEHYGAWAYRGEAANHTGAPMDLARVDHAARKARQREPLPRFGTQCGELLYRKDLTHLDRSSDENHADDLRRHGSGIIWGNLANPVVIVHLVRPLSAWAFFITLFTSLAIFLGWLLGDGRSPSPTFIGYGLGVPVALYVLSRVLIHYDVVPHLNNTVFRRDTGLIEIPRGWFRKPVYLPFAEFDPYVIGDTPWTGATRYRLLLAHRQTERVLISPGGGTMEKVKAAVEWEQLEQYMDITRPLPEVPDLEGIRGDDPTTVAFDAAHGRPARFWPRMTVNGFMALQQASRVPAKQFPWGLTRGRAYAEGWQPSPHGALVAGELGYADLVAWLDKYGYWKKADTPQATTRAKPNATAAAEPAPPAEAAPAETASGPHE